MARITLIEDHHKALHIWRKHKLNNNTLIHFDAHHDCDINYMSLKRNRYQQIGNFIFNALNENIINSFYWIIPGFNEDYKKGYPRLIQLLYQLKQKDYIGHFAVIECETYIRTKILGKDFYITTIDSLSKLEINDKVLLDIDLDYFVIRSLYKDRAYDDIGLRKPWIRISKFMQYLRKLSIQPDITTISYSVNGGWTPMKYKHYGNILAKKLGLNTRRNELKILAGSIFNKFRHEFEKNKFSNAVNYYFPALELNPSYFSFDNNFGLLYLMRGDIQKTKKEFTNMLRIDKKYYYSYVGLGLVQIIKKKYKQAITYFDEALRINPEDILSNRLKLLAYFRLKDYYNCERILKSNSNLMKLNTAKHLIGSIETIDRQFKNLNKTNPVENINFIDKLFYEN